MRKTFSLLLAAMMLCLLAACGSSADSAPQAAAAAQPEDGQEEPATAPEEAPAEQPDGNCMWEITCQKARAYVDDSGTPWTQSIVEITNTSDKNLYLDTSFYNLEDADGNMLRKDSLIFAYPAVLAPGEKGYLYDVAQLEDYSGGEGELTILPYPEIEEATVPLNRYDIVEYSVSDNSDGQISVTGEIKNATEEFPSLTVYVAAFFYDENGTLLGGAVNVPDDIPMPGTTVGFELSAYGLPEDVTAEDVADTVLYAYMKDYQD